MKLHNKTGTVGVEQVEDSLVISTCVYDYMFSSVCAMQACIYLSVLVSQVKMCQPKCVP